MAVVKKKLNKYINILAAEKKPKEQRASANKDYTILTDTVRRIKSLREPVMPGEDYEQRLLQAVRAAEAAKAEAGNTKVTTGGMNIKQEKNRFDTHTGRVSGIVKRTLIGVTAAAAAAAALLYMIPDISLPGRKENIAYAMEQALQELKAYHGIIEVVENNAAGERMLQSRREVWADQEGNYYLKELEGYPAGTVTVNNTDQEWQIRPQDKKVYLTAAFPDPYRFTFELGDEVKEVKNARTVKKIGEETVSGRAAILFEITPDGGAAYHLWVDKETDLPLKKQTAMQNALQVTVTFTDIEFEDSIPKELLSYQLPQGYEEVKLNPEQPVASLEEAAEIAGIAPELPKTMPSSWELKGISVLTGSLTIKMDYENTGEKTTAVILEARAAGDLKPASGAALGSVNGSMAEFLQNYGDAKGVNSIRWIGNGMEYRIYGNISREALADMAIGLTAGEVRLPEETAGTDKPQVEVQADLIVEENDQKSVDAGNSPWKLDPVYVAQVYANLLIAPDGIVGEYQIPYEAAELEKSDGVDAVVRINSDKSAAARIYLKRLVRKDETGIWSVVGYDPVE